MQLYALTLFAVLNDEGYSTIQLAYADSEEKAHVTAIEKAYQRWPLAEGWRMYDAFVLPVEMPDSPL